MTLLRKLFLAIGAVALIGLAGFVAAQAAPQDQTSAEASAATASQPDPGTKLRLAAMDTSAAAFRKLDADNDGRISALEAADNPRVAAAFTMADQDKDGYLSKEEFESMRSAGPASTSPQPRATPPQK
jgi:hypothetical protein